jgi:hypothetical protein
MFVVLVEGDSVPFKVIIPFTKDVDDLNELVHEKGIGTRKTPRSW